ncbi:MAG: imidazolonepropionase [Ilumatobacter sp.]|nr:imidazolonepropionase [Ilumatobacter sp.]
MADTITTNDTTGWSLVIDNIGSLITNDPTIGRGPLGIVDDASVVIVDGRVEHVGAAGTADTQVDEWIDAEGRCALPGFVDSHTHLVFAGDRAAEFTARMAGQPYDGGGIRVTTDATRAASTADLDRLVRRRLAEAHRAGTTTIEIKSGYGLNVADEARSVEIAHAHTSESTFLGAHLLPAEYEGRADDYIHLVCNEMLVAARPTSKWVDAFCETGAFDADQCGAVLDAGRAAGLGLRLHGNQLGHGPGVQLAVEHGCASVDHCTYLTDADIGALAGSDTVATFLPATDFSTRQPYPDARRVIDAGATVALASNCNPGSSYTTSISFCIALAVREMGMTVDEAVTAATLGGAAALRRDDVGRLTRGAAGHVVVLDAPSHHHLAYRPGVPLVHRTIGPLADHPSTSASDAPDTAGA